MARKSKKTEDLEAGPIGLMKLEVARMRVYVIGTTPLLMHRQSEKVKREMLLPSRKKNKAERESIAKHDPVAEFRAAAYMTRENDAPTAMHMPAGAFKGAIKNAALRIPGGNKTETGQLVSLEHEVVDIYGIPLLDARMVRQGGMTKTPDIRFRPVFPRWCAVLDINYVPPLINDEILFNLISGGGLIMGVGDGRTEKGSLNFGSFRPTDEDDPELQEIMRTGGRAAQLKAMREATPYNDDSAELMAWFIEEARRRRLSYVPPGSPLGTVATGRFTEDPDEQHDGKDRRKSKRKDEDELPKLTARRGRPRKNGNVTLDA